MFERCLEFESFSSGRIVMVATQGIYPLVSTQNLEICLKNAIQLTMAIV